MLDFTRDSSIERKSGSGEHYILITPVTAAFCSFCKVSKHVIMVHIMQIVR